MCVYSVYMYVYVYVCVYIVYMRMYVCIYIHVYVYVCVCLVCICMYVCMYIHMNIYKVFMSMYVRIYDYAKTSGKNVSRVADKRSFAWQYQQLLRLYYVS